jgi:hypothetical protein
LRSEIFGEEEYLQYSFIVHTRFEWLWNFFGNIDGAERRIITRAARKSVACKPLCQNLYVKVEPGVADLLLILEVAAAASRATDFLAARVVMFN